jgi:predicted phage tail protein
MDFPIMGAGGGGKGGGGGGISEAPDTLRSSEKAIVLDALCEGPVQGLVNGAQSVYFDGVPLQNADLTWNFNQAVFGYTTGTLGSNSNGASSLTGDGSSVESTYPVATKIYQATPLVQSITTANVDTVRVTLNVPSLTSTDASSGKLNGASVEFTIGIQTAGGGYVIRVHDTINGKTSSNYARSYVIPLSGAGPFDIQVTRITPDSGSSLLVNDLYWQDYTSIISTHLEYRHTAMAYTAIDAQQFSSIPQRAFDMQGLIIQVPSNYNPTTRVYTGTWDGTFQLAYSNNPAWCFYDLLTNSRYGLGDMIPATSLNKWQLYVIGQYCDQMVSDGFGGTEPRFTCNLLIQGEAEAYTVVQNMAAIFRGMAYWSAGSIAVTQDAPATPVQSFTPANVIGGVFNYQGTSLKARHTVALVTWNDPAQQYKQVVEYVQDDALVAKYGVVKAQVTAMGCTSRGQAHRWGQWLLYTENLETEAISFKASLDGTFLTPGAIIQTSDPNRAGARMGGRVLGISADGLTLTLDSAVPSGSGFTVQVAFPDGTMGSSAVSSVSGNNIVLPAALAQTPVSGAIYILSETTLIPEQWRVVTISESAPNEVQIGATTYNSSKYAFIEDGLPLAIAQTSTIQAVPAVPTNLVLAISLYITDTGPNGVRGTLSWTGNATKYIVTAQKVGGAIVSHTVTQCSTDFDNLDPETVYTFGVTAVSAIGIQSQPATLVETTTLTVIGLPAPSPVQVFCTPDANGNVTKVKVLANFTQSLNPYFADQYLAFMVAVDDNPPTFTIASDGGTSLEMSGIDILATGNNYTILAGSTVNRLIVTNSANPLPTTLNLAGMFWGQFGTSQWRKVTSYDSLGFNFATPFDVAPVAGQALNWVETSWADERDPQYRMAVLTSGSSHEVILWDHISQVGGSFYLEGLTRAQEGTTQISATGGSAAYYPAPGAGTQLFSLPCAVMIPQGGGVYEGEIDVNVQIPAGAWVAMTAALYRNTTTGIVRSNIVPATYGGPL